MLALQPVAQAFGPGAGPGDDAKLVHKLMVMDCGQMDPDHCVDFDDCTAGSHSGCDSKSKTSLLAPTSINNASGNIYIARPVDRYFSHLTELILRPPRNA